MIRKLENIGGYFMKYMGSKNRFKNEIIPIILKNKKADQYYVEPFAGGMNIICEIKGKRIANDINFYLIEMWKKLISGWKPKQITKKKYLKVKSNKNNYSPGYVGWVGFNCSYSGKWFGGFAGKTKTKIGTIRNYQIEAINNVSKQVKKMETVVFQNKQYFDLDLPENSIIYCDPPYKNTTSYGFTFDHNLFWNWVRNISKYGHTVYVSEYSAPNDFSCIWSKKAKSSLSANGKIGGSKNSVEKLFTI